MLIAAAVLLVLLAGFHSVVGERLILQPINRADNLPKIWNSRQAMFRTLQATWHLVSVLWLGLAVHLVMIELAPTRSVASFLGIFGVIFAALAIAPLVLKAGKHKTWVPFGLIAAMLLGSLYLA